MNEEWRIHVSGLRKEPKASRSWVSIGNPTVIEWFYGMFISMVSGGTLLALRYKDVITSGEFQWMLAVDLVCVLAVITIGRFVAHYAEKRTKERE